MIKDLVQKSLDAVFHEKDIYVYEQRKTGADADEYIVYRVGGDPPDFYADNKPITKHYNVTISYYYRSEKLDNYTTRKEVRVNEELISSTLQTVDISIPYGYFDAGDVDDIGYHTTIFECEYWRVV